MRKRPNPDSEANIRRIDTKRRAKKQTHGFQVHFLRGTAVLTKMFSDSLYGGKEAARRAARNFRRNAMRGLPEPRIGGFKSRTRRRAAANQRMSRRPRRKR
jgi:hypothetical protein